MINIDATNRNKLTHMPDFKSDFKPKFQPTKSCMFHYCVFIMLFFGCDVNIYFYGYPSCENVNIVHEYTILKCLLLHF